MVLFRCGGWVGWLQGRWISWWSVFLVKNWVYRFVSISFLKNYEFEKFILKWKKRFFFHSRISWVSLRLDCDFMENFGRSGVGRIFGQKLKWLFPLSFWKKYKIRKLQSEIDTRRKSILYFHFCFYPLGSKCKALRLGVLIFY